MDQDRRQHEEHQVSRGRMEWSQVPRSVGPTGVCWAVDKGDTVWRRLGAKVRRQEVASPGVIRQTMPWGRSGSR